ncbi:hypothetical protein QCM77_38735 [Bradyrhizobium sp. SSUT18]|uniref:hypothetical protein n=1 Tax=Bradyrhizobium sp. SSUT18 TaxID=3040602 RepID=UPI00244779CE|nr:hypothetical protein [Bradyrhizobium sp. SSUT18]MDH2405789.1 hypothetical protein [Bradyrhizobium sp. SSUT18]
MPITPKTGSLFHAETQDRIVTFDLTTLAKAGDDAHDRAFEDVTSVMGMIKQRLSEGQSLTDQRSGAANSLGLITDQAGR